MTQGSTSAILVGGGKGGVGKSSVSAGIARGLREAGLDVGLLDADLSGPSQNLLLSCSRMEGAAGEIVPAQSSEGIRVVSTGLISRADSALVWSGPTATAAIESFASPGVWAGADVVIVDLPPGHGEIAMKVATSFLRARAVLVTTGSALAVDECRRAANFMQRMEIPILGLVDNMARTYCGACASYSEVFPGDRVEALGGEIGVPVLARVTFGSDPAFGEAMAPVVSAIALGLGLPAERRRELSGIEG